MRSLIALIVAIGFIVGSCNIEEVKFQDPQPLDVTEESQFSKKYIGSYLRSIDSTQSIEITKTALIKIHTLRFKTHLEDATPEVQDMAAKIRDLDDEKSIGSISDPSFSDLEMIDDTIFGTWTYYDTLFMIGDDMILKQYKNAYFLNVQRRDGFWSVSRLHFDDKKLLLEKIKPSDDLTAFEFTEKLEPVEKENTPEGAEPSKDNDYVLSPSKKELKKFVNSGGFNEREIYVKL